MAVPMGDTLQQGVDSNNRETSGTAQIEQNNKPWTAPLAPVKISSQGPQKLNRVGPLGFKHIFILSISLENNSV